MRRPPRVSPRRSAGGEHLHRCVVAAFPNWEYGEHCIADESQDLAAARDHRTGSALEVPVEELDERLGVEAVGEPRRVAHVAVPDDGVDALAVAVPYLPFQYPGTGVRSEIGLQNVPGDSILNLNLAGNREAALNPREDPQVFVAEAGGPIRRP